MNITGRKENAGRPLSTADLAAAARRPAETVDDDDLDHLPMSSSNVEEPELAESQDLALSRAEARAESRDYVAPQDRAEPRAPRERSARESFAPPNADAQREALEPLFTPDKAESYRARWTSIQSGFVDDPRQAVRAGDELVAQVMSNLAKTFAEERSRVEGQLDQTGEGTTENLRVALRRYRSFFERLLAL